MAVMGAKGGAAVLCVCAALSAFGVPGAARQTGSPGPKADAGWSVVTSGIDTNLRGLSVVSPPRGAAGALVVWASGSNGVVLKSTDGGKNWERIAVPGGDELDFRGVRAFSSAAAYVMSSGSGDKSKMFKTIDGGATWKMQFTDTRPAFFLDAIACDGEMKCVALSDPVDGKFVIVRTTDGETWQIAPSTGMPDAHKDEGAFAASNSSLAIFRNSKRGDARSLAFATGGPNGARLFQSADFGETWTAMDTPLAGGNAAAGIFSLLRLAGNGEFVVVGGDYKNPTNAEHTAAISSDGGKQFALASAQPAGYRSSVAFVGGAGLLAAGPGGADESEDGGEHWKPAELTGMNVLASVPVRGGVQIWAAGAKGTIERSLRAITPAANRKRSGMK
jgi:photosystem II stability/assembly factor-like uncharacterized protein